MANKPVVDYTQRSSKRPYPSRYSPEGWVSPNQYIIELVCEHKATSQDTDLPVRFWQDPAWEKYFIRQTRACASLLKHYSAEAVIAALKTPSGSKVYSLSAPWLRDIVAVEQKKIDNRPIPMESGIKPVENNRVRESRVEENMRAQLFDLD